ncbi:hypothetical protein ACDQ56_11640 [Fusobacterium animalis]|uniref:hypothetical protein n=1 Tax=Fusobacterium animalis TaxID=76859 RepID=UPI0035568C39
MGADIHFNLSKNKKLFSGIRLSPSVLLKSIDMAKAFNNKYFEGEAYVSADVSGVVWSNLIK